MWCWYYRMRFQMKLDSRTQTPTLPLTGHLDRCPACRQYAGRLLRLHEQLQAPAAESISDSQLDRIQTAVMGKLAVPAPANRFIFPRPAVLATAAALLLALGLWSLLTRPAPQPQPLAPQPRLALTLDPAIVSAPIARALTLPQASLGKELQLLAADTRQALTHLQNCLPTPPAALSATPD